MRGLVGASRFELETSCAQVLKADCDRLLLRALQCPSCGVSARSCEGFSALLSHLVIGRISPSRSGTQGGCVTNHGTKVPTGEAICTGTRATPRSGRVGRGGRARGDPARRDFPRFGHFRLFRSHSLHPPSISRQGRHIDRRARTTTAQSAASDKEH